MASLCARRCLSSLRCAHHTLLPRNAAWAAPARDLSAFTRNQRARSKSRTQQRYQPPPEVVEEKREAVDAPARRTKNSPPGPVTPAQIELYQQSQSRYARLSSLTQRLHWTFALIDAYDGAVTASVLSSLSALTRVFASLAPYDSPFPLWAYHNYVTLLSKVSPTNAYRELSDCHDKYGLKPSVECAVAVAEALALVGKSSAVEQLIDKLAAWSLPLNTALAQAWITAVPASNLTERKRVLGVARSRGMRLSARIYEAVMESLSASGRTDELQSLINEWRTQHTAITPTMAYHCSRVMPLKEIESLHALMSYHCHRDPESTHAVYESLTDIGLTPTTMTYTLLITAYANRHATYIDSKDVVRIERLIERMTEHRLDRSVDISLIEARIAAQRGLGDRMVGIVEAVIINRQTRPLVSSASFLPILQALASLSSPHRLTTLSFVHSLLHTHGLSSSFTFSLLMRAQCELHELPALKASWSVMVKSSVPATIHHYTHLYRCYAFHPTYTAEQRLARQSLLLKAMEAVHLKHPPLFEALHLVALSLNDSLERAEDHYRVLRSLSQIEPHPYTRLAMIDAYLHWGFVRHAARHYVKLMTGGNDRVEVKHDSDAIITPLTHEEMLRMLRALPRHGKGQQAKSEVERLTREVESSGQTQSVNGAVDASPVRDELYRVEWTAEFVRLVGERDAARRLADRGALLVQLRKARDDAHNYHRSVSGGGHGRREVVPAASLQSSFLALMRQVAIDVTFVHMDVTKPKHKQFQAAMGAAAESERASVSVGSLPFHEAVEALGVEELDFPHNNQLPADEAESGVTFALDVDTPRTQTRSTSEARTTAATEPPSAAAAVSSDPLLAAAHKLVQSRTTKQ